MRSAQNSDGLNLPADRYISLWAYHRDHPPSYFVVAVGPHATPRGLVRRTLTEKGSRIALRLNRGVGG